MPLLCNEKREEVFTQRLSRTHNSGETVRTRERRNVLREELGREDTQKVEYLLKKLTG